MVPALYPSLPFDNNVTLMPTSTDTDNHHPYDNDDDPNSSIHQTPIDSYSLTTALVLDAALRDFGHDTDQQHLREPATAHISQPCTTTDAKTDTPPNTDLPPPLRAQIDSYFTGATLILDAALHDFDHIAAPRAPPTHDECNNNVPTPAHRHSSDATTPPVQQRMQHGH